MNKDRLNLCKSFTTAKTIEEIKKEKDKKEIDDYWEEQRKKQEIRRFLNRLCYQRRPWYKKIFD
jgi:hypothetical protein